jgi:P-type E1-E2 ATPase
MVESTETQEVGARIPTTTPPLRLVRILREQAESGLRFLGLIIFENKLKPGTSPVIQTLRSAHLACRMITGDNPLTAVSVARECSLINQAAHVFSAVFIQGLTYVLICIFHLIWVIRL